MSAQIGRIARLLGIDPAEVQGLDGVPAADLRELHDQISARLFAAHQRRFGRIAALSKTIPGPLAGLLAEKFLPPVMAARVSEALDPARARDLIGRVSVRYLAEIALALDPVRSRPVVQQLPPEPIGRVARELFVRREYATMAEFVGTVTVDALMAAFEVATPHDLLAVVPLLEWNDNLDVVVADLPHHKVTEIATVLTPVELADLALALEPDRMGPIVAAVPAEVAAGIARSLVDRGAHEPMARFIGVVTPDIVDAVVRDLPPTEIAEVARVLFVDGQVAAVVRFVDLVGDLPDALVDTLLAEIAAGEDWDAAKQAFEEIGPDAQQALFARFDRLAPAHQDRFRAAADAGELGPAATALMATRA